ncbi:MAG: prohibitin family protein [Helicobacter sp.]|nr:prohibitin family protein [Helicobacter sp.]
MRIALFVVVGLLILSAFFGNPIAIINAGETGIRATFGRFDPVPLNAGMHFYVPLFQRIIIIDSKVKLLNFSNNPQQEMASNQAHQSMLARPAIVTLDKAGLRVLIDASIQYSLNQSEIPQTISEYTEDWDERLIVGPAQGIVRDVLGHYSAEELPNKRDIIASEILGALRAYLASIPNTPVVLQSFTLKNILLPEAVREQIQLVQVAQQEAQRAKEEIARVKEEAQKMIEQAGGEAQAKRIHAEGIADAILIEAKAREQANNAIKQSLSEKLLELRAIETQGRFNEALRNNKDAQIFLAPGGSTPNLWIDGANTPLRQKILSTQGQP